MARLGFAIVGLGNRARRYADAILRHTKTDLIEVHSRRAEAVEEFRSTYGCGGGTDFQSVLANSAVDAVVVATEPAMHTQAIDAINAGKHVIVEKPLAETNAEGRRILSAAQNSPRVCAAGLQRRFDGSGEVLRRLVEAGQVGRIRSVDYRSFSRARAGEARPNWRSGPGGSIFLDHLIHVFDHLTDMFGQAESLMAATLRDPQAAGESFGATVQLRLPQGIAANIIAVEGTERLSGESLVVYGDRAGVELGRTRSVLIPYPFAWPASARQLLISGVRQVLGSPKGGTVFRHNQGSIADVLDDFVDSIESARPPRVTLQDSYKALCIASTAAKSAATADWTPIDVT